MFREMRRIKQQIEPDACIELLKAEKRGTLAVIGDDGYPYALPINFIYDEQDGCIYFHSSKVGHKLDAIRACGKVCFTVHNEGYRKDDWSYWVTSVVVFGRAELLTDPDVTYEKARKFGEKYIPTREELETELKNSAARVQMVRITPEHMTGKLVHEK